MGDPLQPIAHTLLSQWVQFYMTNAIGWLILALEMTAMGD